MSDWHPATTPNFSAAEMACKCGECDGAALMDQAFMEKLQRLRTAISKPLTITSAYRCPLHPETVRRPNSMHAKGRAVDIAYDDAEKHLMIVMIGMNLGFKGFGFHRSFTHIDDRETYARWTY